MSERSILLYLYTSSVNKEYYWEWHFLHPFIRCLCNYYEIVLPRIVGKTSHQLQYYCTAWQLATLPIHLQKLLLASISLKKTERQEVRTRYSKSIRTTSHTWSDGRCCCDKKKSCHWQHFHTMPLLNVLSKMHDLPTLLVVLNRSVFLLA